MASELTEIPRSEYTAAVINSIKKRYGHLRDTSKPVTFALQYQGIWTTLVKNCGFSAAEAKTIEKNYHQRYQVSDAWVNQRLKEASETGYITGAFGLRIRTPLLERTVWKGKSTPYEASAEARTAGNALGQSWCLLNSRAGNEFMERVWASEYAEVILPCAQIHDALYFLIKADFEVLHWVNINLIECMQWQDHPLLEHDTVKLGAALDVHYKDWSQPVELPNKATLEQIKALCKKGAQEYKSKK